MFEIIVGVFVFRVLVLYYLEIFELMFSMFEFSVLVLVIFEFVFVNMLCFWFY